MSNPKGINQYSKAGAGMARSYHNGAKKEFSRIGAFNIMGDTSKAGRKGIANQIREVRRNPKPSQVVAFNAVSSAAASTRLRNLAKMGKAR